MTNYEAIKNMSIEEMATMFYLFILPSLDALDMDEENKKTIRENSKKNIRAFLKSEVTKPKEKKSE